MDILGVLGITGAAATAIAVFLLGKIKKFFATQESRAEARKEESMLTLRGLKAVGHLSEAVAIAQKAGVPNGETDKALSYYHEYAKDLNGYLYRQAAANHE